MKAKKIFCSVLVATVAVGAIGISAYAENEKKMSITLRIEGIKENLYYDTVEVPYTSDNLTVQNALMYIDKQNDDISIKGVEKSWITAVNDDVQGAFGGWDGWLYTVNGVSPSDTLETYNLSDGDNIILYYGDPFGIGMQYPNVNYSEISNGVLTFTSNDTVYDADFNPTIVVNPVSNATVTWNYDGGKIDYTTDENGSIKIDKEYLTEGGHNISINKVSDNGIPLVLRFAPDYSIDVPVIDASISEPESSVESSDFSSEPESSVESNVSISTVESSNDTINNVSEGKAPSTGDNSEAVIIAVFAASLIFTTAIVLGKKKYEK